MLGILPDLGGDGTYCFVLDFGVLVLLLCLFVVFLFGVLGGVAVFGGVLFGVLVFLVGLIGVDGGWLRMQ